MKMRQQSKFLKQALEDFPVYTEEVANCWACVGPKHLTNTYIKMSKSSHKNLPSLVDSSRLFGDSKYRSNLKTMYEQFNLSALMNAVESKSIAFHLFTSSGEHLLRPKSFIDFLFQVSTGDDDSPQYIP